MFERGFPAALVEYVAKDTTTITQKYLDEVYSSENIINTIVRNEEDYINNRFFPPTSKDVAASAIIKKLEALMPYCEKWPSAVGVEYQTQNIPYTLITLTEFVDSSSFYIERVENLNQLLLPAKQIIQSKVMSSYIPIGNEESSSSKSPLSNTAKFLRTFIAGVPLSSGPHMSTSNFSMDWYMKRAQLGFIYCTCVTSLLGDTSAGKAETKALAKKIAHCLF
ncbi:hypothetical protein STCU_02076 [Strigomonas culicis]|uniref:Ubiquinone biosynthesis protein n=1 Tax=Strigomonas culicis TaxID=28005 RepID=S9WCC5_9TRYP|nr:hypothetical protein STCU_02076 [Strigomonas culicis]|eukprot:EPY33690.1 hypothetical protein STCU_02076 [Strigomonas culicis]